MTTYKMEIKMPEKTTQVSIGENRHKMILEMQKLYEERLELKVTIRAIVERAISKYHKEMCTPPTE